MKIIYVSVLTSKRLIMESLKNGKKNILQSTQKFHRILCKGLVKNNQYVKTYSWAPIGKNVRNKKEEEDGIKYNYLTFINIKIIKNICVGLQMIKNVIKESFKEKKEKVFICDILSYYISIPTLIMCKLLRIKCYAIVTDLPRDIGEKNTIRKKFFIKFQSKYDGYIFLTKYMNDVINTKNKPYTVVETLVDSDIQLIPKENNKNNIKVCMYAGGLYEKYGIKNLIEAFRGLELNDVVLHLYGFGDIEDYLNNIHDEKISYLGIADNNTILEEERKSVLLINPRFSSEEYTKYSFPSKNMEYMASGTATLTTRLKGIPDEYFKYVYCFDDESIEGMKTTLNNVLSKSVDEINQKGYMAQEFVLKYKNDIEQTKKIINLLRTTKIK